MRKQTCYISRKVMEIYAKKELIKNLEKEIKNMSDAELYQYLNNSYLYKKIKINIDKQ